MILLLLLVLGLVVLLLHQLALAPLDEGCISFIISRVLGALSYLHGAGRIHRCGVIELQVCSASDLLSFIEHD
jgi:hypothetical protein